jgi:hypothetical protein
MEALATVVTLMVALIGFGLAAMRSGSDSREAVRDEHRGWPIH